jgi:nucleoside-diphosphate-sugar epimerase
MSKLKIVVTGATGLLGRATAAHLVGQGHEVISVDRREGDFAQGSKPVSYTHLTLPTSP